MKLNNGQNIINDQDINLTGSNIGKTLSSFLNKQQEDVDKLKSNVKWLYKYGGVGSGGGSGSGSSSSNYSVFATLDSKQIGTTSGEANTIALASVGNYQLLIRLIKPDTSAVYSVTVNYYNRTGATVSKQTLSFKLTIDNSFKFEQLISLNTNDSITITVDDFQNEPKQITANYITTPYAFGLNLTKDDTSTYPQSNGNIFIQEANSWGLNVTLPYSIAVKYQSCQVDYSIIGPNVNITQTKNITDTNGALIFPIDKTTILQNQNSGSYNIIINVTLLPEGEVVPITKKLIQQINLIPKELYLQVVPETGIIYQTSQTDVVEDDMYNIGYVSFNVRAFKGEANNETFNFQIKLNGNSYTDKTIPTTLNERENVLISINLITPGENVITFTVSGQDFAYYLYVKEPKSDIEYYNPDYGLDITNSYYRNGNSNITDLSSFNGGILMSANSSNFTISSFKQPNVYQDTVLNLGLQYNSVNNVNKPLINIYSNNILVYTLYKNKLNKTNVGDIKICIHKESNFDSTNVLKYHLIQIVSRFMAIIDQIPYYEVSVYIDGILDSCFQQGQNAPLQINSLELLPGNYAVNTIDLAYFGTGLSSGQTKASQTWTEQDIYRYYLAYKSQVQTLDVDNEIALLELLNGVTLSDENFVQIPDKATIDNIAKKVSIPTVLFKLTEDDTHPYATIINDLNKYYRDDDNNIPKYTASISYANAKSSLIDVEIPTDVDSVFTIKPQGSSTRAFRAKNFTLSIEKKSSESTFIPLFSPNYKAGNYSTYLPETEFTLKADVVDSSHSNNTAIGKFVNKNTTKFNTGITGTFSKYIKNCLEGYHYLQFLQITYTNETGNEANAFFYLGVYNFNLGRGSQFNLGYMKQSTYDTLEGVIVEANDKSGPFSIQTLPSATVSYNQNLVVAEVQNGNSYYDFSQYHESILFAQTDQDSASMFGDISREIGDMIAGNSNTYKDSLIQMVKSATRAGGYLFNYIGHTFGPQTDEYNKVDEHDISMNQVPQYKTQYRRTIEGGQQVYTPITPDIEPATISDLEKAILGNETTQPDFDYTSIVEYYVICMAFGLVDSVQKNLNLKTFNNKKYHAAFYDMDSALNKENAGKPFDYFAFSDFWQSDSIGNTTIYRDFFNKNIGVTGFDIPSSYLFAIAKYAYLAVGDRLNNMFPQQLWAIYRDADKGELKNADYFIDNYFVRDLNDLPSILHTYDFRYKYFVQGSAKNTYDALNFEKFNGRSVESLREWFAGRLHLLDAYFNISRAVIGYQYRDSNGVYQWLKDDGGVGINEPIPIVEGLNLSGNDDIIVYKDMFSEGGRQYGQDFNVTVTANKYTPIILNSPTMVSLSLLNDPDTQYNIVKKTTGIQAIKMGGSRELTSIQSINSVCGKTPSDTTELYLYNNYIDTVQGDSGYLTSYNLNLPYLQILSLTGNNYSGDLSMNRTKFPNLNSVDISGSKISLSIDSSDVKYVSATNCKTNLLKVTNCPSIQSLQFSGTFNNVILDNLKTDISMNTNSITQMTLNFSTPKNCTINNDPNLTTLTLINASSLTINNCPKLTTIQIQETIPGSFKSLNLTSCTALSSIYNSNQVENVLDLAHLQQLNTIKVNNNNTFTQINLYPIATLNCNGFSNCKKLTNINYTGLIYVNTSNLFVNCPLFKATTTSNQALKFYANYADLNHMFANTAIDTTTASTILNNFANKTKVTNMQGMFNNCPNISYTKDQFVADYSAQKCIFPFGSFQNCSNFSYMFFRTTGMAYFNRYMWLGIQSSRINISNFSEIINITEDGLYEIAHRVTNLWCTSANIDIEDYNYGLSSRYLYSVDVIPISLNFIDSSGNPINNINLYSFYSPQNLDMSSLISIQKSKMPDNTTISLLSVNGDNIFDKMKNVQTINCSFNETSVTYTYNDQPELLFNLSGMTSLYSIINSFNTIGTTEYKYYDNINWNQFILNTKNYNTTVKLFRREYYYSDSVNSFGTNKTITWQQCTDIMNLCLNNNLNNMDSLFRECTITIPYNTVLIIGEGILKKSSTIASCRAMFYCSKFVDSQGNKMYPILNHETMYNLQNCQQYNSMFSSTSLNNVPTLDFFNKRQENINSVFVKINDVMTPAVMHIFNYKSNNDQINSMFSGCTFQQKYYDSTQDIVLQANYIEVNGEKTDIKEYYSSDTSTTKKTLVENYELMSTLGQPYNYCANTSIGVHGITDYNFSLEGLNEFCLPPDFFYACSSSSSITYCFANTDITGQLPQYLLKNCMTISIDGTFYGARIIPVKRLETEFIKNSNTYSEAIYSFVPSNFTNYSDLRNSFRFRAVIPKLLTYTDVNQKNEKLVVFLKSSVSKNITSLNYTWPLVSYSNILWTQTKTDSYTNFNLCFDDITHDINKKEGIDLEYFNSLYLDGIISSELAPILSGNVFTNVPSTLKYNNDFIIKIDVGRLAHININCILPALSYVHKMFILTNNYSATNITPDQISNFATSQNYYKQSVKYYSNGAYVVNDRITFNNVT